MKIEYAKHPFGWEQTTKRRRRKHKLWKHKTFWQTMDFFSLLERGNGIKCSKHYKAPHRRHNQNNMVTDSKISNEMPKNKTTIRNKRGKRQNKMWSNFTFIDRTICLQYYLKLLVIGLWHHVQRVGVKLPFTLGELSGHSSTLVQEPRTS